MKVTKIESDDDINLTDTDSDKTVIEHKHIPQPPLSIEYIVDEITSKIKTASDTNIFQLPKIIFRACTLWEIEEDIITSSLNGDDITYSVSELNDHFKRSKGYSDGDKKEIVNNLIGKMAGRQIPKTRIDHAKNILDKIL